MIASDLIRAVLVIAIPFAAAANVYLVYPLVFLVTTVSLFFRPAKVAVIPRIVHADDVMAAKQRHLDGGHAGRLMGFPIAGLFVAFLGGQASSARRWPSSPTRRPTSSRPCCWRRSS